MSFAVFIGKSCRYVILRYRYCKKGEHHVQKSDRYIDDRSCTYTPAKGLPHYTMILKKRWDDPKLALTPKQKSKLLEVRKATMEAIMALKPKIAKLRKKIAKAAMSGATPESLTADVEKLAKLKADATRTHLRCIYDTRQILTPSQLEYINSTMRRKHK